MRILELIAVVTLLATAVACTDGSQSTEKGPMVDLSQVTPEQWQALSQRTIYFGHQSVGGNIMDGIRDITAAKPELRLRVVSGQTAAPGVLNEFPIGRNEDTDSKNAGFLAATQGTLGPKPVLMMKYCYVDVEPDTDTKRLFEGYQQTVSALRAKHPDATIVHVTMPLTTDSKIGNFVNRIRGRPTRQTRNGVRAQYNELLRAAYAGKEPIFDLAAAESTRADGTREYATVDGKTVYALARDWASDDGHLNAAGRRRAAEEMLITLASLPENSARTR